MMGIVGAGDLKLLFAFGLASCPEAVFYTAAYSLFWAAIFGFAIVLCKGLLVSYIKNIYMIILHRRGANLAMQSMPYTVALFFGWLTYLKVGGEL